MATTGDKTFWLFMLQTHCKNYNSVELSLCFRLLECGNVVFWISTPDCPGALHVQITFLLSVPDLQAVNNGVVFTE